MLATLHPPALNSPVTGPAGDGALFTGSPDARDKPEAAEVVGRFRAASYEPEGGTLYTYASIQVWAQAVEKAGTLELDAVIEALRSHEFDTVLGRIGFDDNGDVSGPDTYVWYRWTNGAYVPVELQGCEVAPASRAMMLNRRTRGSG